RGIGGITRANPAGVVRLERAAGKAGTIDLSFGVNVNRPIHGGTIRLKDGSRVVATEALDLTPAQSVLRARRGLPPAPKYTLEVVDADGRVLLTHTEGSWDYAPEATIHLGRQPAPVTPEGEKRSDGAFVDLGDTQERDGKLLGAWETYRGGLDRFPQSVGLMKAAGRLAVTLKRGDEAVPLLTRSLERVSNDPETQYYLGLAHAASGDDAKARIAWEGAQILAPFRAPARLELASLDARGGDLGAALARVRALLGESRDVVRAGGVEVALLRRLDRAAEAREALAHWRTVDPTGNFLRHEAVLLGADDPELWLHLAGDPDRVLGLAEDYMALGFYKEAVELLVRRYPTGAGVMAEPGTPLPQEHPLVAYYRGYCRERMGASGVDDYRAAAALPTRYVFPSRPNTLRVLRAALAADPRDATARFLLGSFLLSSGRAEEAIAAWEETRRLNPRIPVLHRNLGLALLHARGDSEAALAVLLEGLDVDGDNTALYVAADEAESLLGRSTGEHIEMLERYPDKAAMPPLLVEKLALALTDAGRGDEAEALFAGRRFPRE
ncbi:MAG: tetratricopeptide repeat protein, partial [Thermoplasmata archaeon]|nr:tetratricopeptide repeat protein [Thermoplasmata archaeon]